MTCTVKFFRQMYITWDETSCLNYGCLPFPKRQKHFQSRRFQLILTLSKRKRKKKYTDVLLMEFMYLVFTRMPGESYRRRLRSLLLHLCYVFRALINSLVCWFSFRRFVKESAAAVCASSPGQNTGWDSAVPVVVYMWRYVEEMRPC